MTMEVRSSFYLGNFSWETFVVWGTEVPCDMLGGCKGVLSDIASEALSPIKLILLGFVIYIIFHSENLAERPRTLKVRFYSRSNNK